MRSSGFLPYGIVKIVKNKTPVYYSGVLYEKYVF
jgi:hypothetical protein